jgi:tRNA pseudouridine55 synthase
MNKATVVNGLWIIDKPAGMTSRDAVNRAWRWLPRGNRIGHTGTLDPLATGVLVVCMGTATRLAEYVQRMEKVYRARIRLGVRSSTDDGEGTLAFAPVTTAPSRADVAGALRAFLGTIEQIPPDHSAAKVTGHRAYALARQGKEVNLPPRPVEVHGITLLEYAFPRLDVEVRCGKGTYIRSLARDLGESLECGAYLEELRRLSVGHFEARDALPLNADRETARNRVLPLVEAVRDLRRLELTPDQRVRLQAGLGVAVAHALEEGEEIAVVSAGGALLAVGVVMEGLLLPRKVFIHNPKKVASDERHGRPCEQEMGQNNGDPAL